MHRYTVGGIYYAYKFTPSITLYGSVAGAVTGYYCFIIIIISSSSSSIIINIIVIIVVVFVTVIIVIQFI